MMLLATALLVNLPWIGDGRPVADGADWYAPRPAAEFHADYVLPPGMSNAVVHIACAGNYLLEGSDFAPRPLWSPFDKTIYADTHEITGVEPYPATNTLQVTVGNGFYNLPPLRFWGSVCFRDHLAQGAPCFKLRIEGVPDLKWTWQPTDIVQNAPYLGTVRDLGASLEIAKGLGSLTNAMPAVEVDGPRGKIVPRRAPEVVVYRTLKGRARWLEEGKRQVIDFGVNATGFVDFTCPGLLPDTRVEVLYGERLNPDGSVNVLTQTAGQIKKGNGGPGAPYLAAQRDVSVSRAVCERDSVSFPFSWHCFRYAEVRGCPELIENATMSLISSDVKETEAGRTFRAANPKLNRLHEVCRNTFRSNLIGVQSDCPGREKLGYGGDIVATCEAMILNYDMKEFYLKTLQDFADEAEDDGWITETAPFVGIADAGGLESREKTRKGPISWALAVPELMNSLLTHYPDATDRILAYYPVCARYVRLMDAANPSGYIPKCIGDHEALERAPDDVTATAHWHRFVSLTARYAEMLGKTADADEFRAIERKVRAAFVRRFVKDGVVANGTQSAQAIALYLGLVPADQVAAAERRLLAAIKEKDFAVSTGIFATRYMLLYLSEHGHLDVAEKLVLHEGYPGWMHMLERGATSLWETWKESDDVYSNCHPMFGSVDEWLLKYATREKPRIILDSDCLSDYDDVGALAMLHALADRGECEILATVACTVDGVSPQTLELVNAYYGRPKLPVGVCRRGQSAWMDEHGKGKLGHLKFMKLVSDYTDLVTKKSWTDYENAVEVYRRALAAQPDGSVTICSLGFLTNLRDLLESGPDRYSPLSGRELVAKKVKQWVAMACNYPNGKEYNSKMDPAASTVALRDWPTPIVFTDFQYGRTLYTGRKVAESDAHRSPVKDIFAASLMPCEQVTPTSWDQLSGHPSWDETAVLIAVRGLELFGIERGSYRMVGTQGDDEWIADPTSQNCRVVEKTSRAEVGAVIDELMCQPPKSAFPVTAQIPAPKASDDLAWVDEAIARFAKNYEVLLANVERDGTYEAAWPRSFEQGKVTYCKDWDWCSGFFQGCLWYLYEATGELKWRAAAEKYTSLQARVRHSNLHHDLGFMFLPSAGNGLILTGEAKYADWLHDAARTMQTRFRPAMNAMQSWGYWGARESWAKKYNAPVIIDNLLNLELWLKLARHPPQGDKTRERDWLDGEVFLDMAKAHADASIGYLVREDGSTYHIADCDPKTGKVIRHLDGQGAGHWSRGQAWAVYGFAMMYDYTNERRYLDTAVKCAEYALNAPNVPADGVPYWDYLAPNIPNEERDTSAAAPLACGLLRLADLTVNAKYREAAIKIAKSLSSEAYFAKPDEQGGFVLKHTVGAKPAKAGVDVPVNYADYYYLELLMDLKR